MRFGSLFVLLFLNVIWMMLDVDGYPHEVQNSSEVDADDSQGSVIVNGLTVNILPDPRNSVYELPPALVQLLAGLKRPRDDRPVPDKVDVGPDGFLYFLGNDTFDTIQGCRGYCHRFRGFRLAIAKTAETLNQIRKYHLGMVDLAIIRWGATVKLLWEDGTPLDRSIVQRSHGKPLINQPGRSDTFIMYPPGPNQILDDLPNGTPEPCVCQGSSERDLF